MPAWAAGAEHQRRKNGHEESVGKLRVGSDVYVGQPQLLPSSTTDSPSSRRAYGGLSTVIASYISAVELIRRGL
jgi:hypothetical protein